MKKFILTLSVILLSFNLSFAAKAKILKDLDIGANNITDGNDNLTFSNLKSAYDHKVAEDAVSGILKGDGAGGYSAASAGTDYLAPFGSQTAKYFYAAPNASSGAPSFRAIAVSDIPTLNQNTTGSSAKWTTARLLAGNSVDGSGNVAFANKFIVQGTSDSGLSGAQFLGSLGTGLLKNTTTTGVLSIATQGTDYYAPSGTDVAVADGGTGKSSWTQYQIPYPSATTTFSQSANLTFNGTTHQVGGTTNYVATSASGIVYGGTARPKRSFFIPGGGFWVSTTSAATGPTKYEYPTNDVNLVRIAFNGTGKTYAECSTVMPKNYDGGTVTAIFYWSVDAGTGTVIWEIAGRAYGDNDAIDQAQGTAVAITDTIIASADMHVSPESSAITIAGTPAGEKFVQFKIDRNGASDTNNGTAYLLGVLIKYTSTQESDA
jgi:hypothetical protein